MDRRKLIRQLRRVQRLERYSRTVQARVQAIALALDLTSEELEFLVTYNDGPNTVADARSKVGHVTLSGADEAARAAAAERAKKRDEAKAAAAAKRREDVKAEREKAKKHRLNKKAERALALARELAAAGFDPFKAAASGQG